VTLALDDDVCLQPKHGLDAVQDIRVQHRTQILQQGVQGLCLQPAVSDLNHVGKQVGVCAGNGNV
jgi:hypothetical protein